LDSYTDQALTITSTVTALASCKGINIQGSQAIVFVIYIAKKLYKKELDYNA